MHAMPAGPGARAETWMGRISRRRRRREVTARAILQIVPRLDAGGAERTTIDIARALTASGYRSLVASEGGSLESELMQAGGELIAMKVASKRPYRILVNAVAIAKIIRARN